MFVFLFLITHHSSLNFHHLLLITHHSSLKIPQFPNIHPFGYCFQFTSLNYFYYFVGPTHSPKEDFSLTLFFFFPSSFSRTFAGSGGRAREIDLRQLNLVINLQRNATQSTTREATIDTQAILFPSKMLIGPCDQIQRNNNFFNFLISEDFFQIPHGHWGNSFQHKLQQRNPITSHFAELTKSFSKVVAKKIYINKIQNLRKPIYDLVQLGPATISQNQAFLFFFSFNPQYPQQPLWFWAWSTSPENSLASLKHPKNS